ncbi:unnamed protein product [Trichobilharzia szidati]|nr:unnamed protein product [Trichobilharzia szidati]
MTAVVAANSSDENLSANHQRSMKTQGNQTEESQSFLQQNQYRQSQVSGFSWPSNLPTAVNYSVNNIPVKSQKPYVMLIGFRATDHPEMGILASLPIIVQIPHRLNRNCDTMDQPHFLFSDKFDAKNKVRRWFVEVPYGATAGILRLARLDNDGDKSCEFTITINSPCIGMNSDKQEVKWSFVELNRCGQSKSGLKRNDKSSPVLGADDFDCASQFAFPINWETDYLELTIAQHWGLEMPAIVVGELYFRGLEPSLRNIVLNTSDRYCRIGLHSNFTSESIQPDIWLTHWCLSVKPYDSKIFYLGHGKNELLVNGHSSYALRLMYRFSCPFKTATTVICLPWLQDMLYSSDYLIHIFHVYDSRGRFMGAGEYDGHREQRPKFTFNLSKGDYKVIAQICHENGPLLKRGSATKLSTVSSTTSNELCQTLDESDSTGGDSTSANSSWSPLQALQNTPLLLRFRLTTGGMETTTSTGTTGAGRKLGSSSSSSNGQSILRFEFSALPSSLNLNGSKACSAMDPLIYDAKQTLMVATGDDDNSDNNNNNNYNNADGDRRRSGSVGGGGASNESFSSNENATDEESRSNRFELVRRLPCLPSRVNACETISIFLGLTDERYPSYAVPGSYFSGTIGFYKSNLLHNKVTYPFRLILDNSNLLSTTTPTTTTTSPASSSIVTPALSPSSSLTTTITPASEQPKKLPISYMGIGVEDMEWIQCIGDLFLFKNRNKKELIADNELANSVRKTFNNNDDDDDLQVPGQQEKQAKEKEEKSGHKYQQQQNHKDDSGDHQPSTKCLLNLCEQAMIMETVQTIPNNQYPDDMLSSNWSVHSVSFDDTKCEEVSDFNESASTMTDVQKDKKIPTSPISKGSESSGPAKDGVDDALISPPSPPPPQQQQQLLLLLLLIAVLIPVS